MTKIEVVQKLEKMMQKCDDENREPTYEKRRESAILLNQYSDLGATELRNFITPPPQTLSAVGNTSGSAPRLFKKPW